MAEYIDANKKVTIQVYDDMTEEWHEEKVTIAEALDKWTDEGCPKSVEAIPVEWIENQRLKCVPHSITWLCLCALVGTWRKEYGIWRKDGGENG